MNPLIDEEDETDLVSGLDPTLAPEDPSAAVAASSPDSALRAYFSPSQSGGEIANRLSAAQGAASKGRFQAQMAQAASNLGAAIARAQPIDQKPFEQLAQSADEPVKNTEKQIALQSTQDKILRDYFAKKEANALAKQKYASELEYKDRYLADRSKRTDALNKMGEASLGIRQDSLNLRKGGQAAHAAESFLKDPVMKVTSTQGQQIDKGLGRIAEIKSGKQKFTTIMKAELEKDLANVLSGGNNSSLGASEKVEFNSVATKWQRALDALNGYQGDINAPEYLKQLEDTFNGLKNDIAEIQSRRADYVASSIGTAYSGNDLATKTIQANLKNNPGALKAPPAAPPVDPRKAQIDAAKLWLQNNPGSPKADDVRKKIQELSS